MRKHDANTKKGKLINFQIAVIAVFCFAYTMHQVYTYKPLKAKKNSAKTIDDTVFESFGKVIPIPDEIKPVAIQPTIKPKPKTIEVIEVVKNTTNTETVEAKTEVAETDTKVTSETTENLTPENGSETTETKHKVKAPVRTHTSRSVDVLPIFPGCAKYSNNEELAACFQQKVQRMINKKFNKSIGEEVGVNGMQRILLYFEIDENGEITNVKARNEHEAFVDEAKRVAKLLPRMQPAKSGNKSVKMAYNVPIIFRSNN